MKSIHLVFCTLLVISTSFAQGQVEIIGEASVFVEGDQLDLHEGNVIQINRSNSILQIRNGDGYVHIYLQNGLKIFQFEREDLYHQPEYIYLLTDRNRNFLSEIKFNNNEDGESCLGRIKEITNYDDQYADR